MMIGTFIGNDGISNPVNNVGGQRNSREITLRKAKDSIRHLCAQVWDCQSTFCDLNSYSSIYKSCYKLNVNPLKKLRLKDYHIDESYRFYKLALGHNFTRGRKAEQVKESYFNSTFRI